MCQLPAGDAEDRLLAFFGVVRAEGETPDELWPLGLAPFIRRAEDGPGNRVVDNGIFGLLPGFAKELAYGCKCAPFLLRVRPRRCLTKHMG